MPEALPAGASLPAVVTQTAALDTAELGELAGMAVRPREFLLKHYPLLVLRHFYSPVLFLQRLCVHRRRLHVRR